MITLGLSRTAQLQNFLISGIYRRTRTLRQNLREAVNFC